jgi:hypothetical protein
MHRRIGWEWTARGFDADRPGRGRCGEASGDVIGNQAAMAHFALRLASVVEEPDGAKDNRDVVAGLEPELAERGVTTERKCGGA